MKKLVILLVCFVLVGCSGFHNPFKPSPFSYGDQVVITATGEQGTINGVAKRSGEYRIKLADGSKWVKENEMSVYIPPK